LAKRVEAYEALLRELEGEVDLPTARQIRKVLQTKHVSSSEKNDDASDDSSTSMGSLDAIDQVDEDLNRNESSRASGFFGKNSEVNWIRKLESGVRMTSPPGRSGSSQNPFNTDGLDASQRQSLERVLPTSIMIITSTTWKFLSLSRAILMPCHRENWQIDISTHT